MTDYVLLASRLDYAAERDEKGFPTRIEKLHAGAIITDLDDAEAERLLSCGAVVVAEVQSTPPRKTRRTRKTASKDTAKNTDASDDKSSDGGDNDDDDLDGLGDDDGDDSDTGTGTDGGDAASTPAPGPVAKPSNTAPPEDWVAYAVSQGFNEAEAAAMSRAELIKALA